MHHVLLKLECKFRKIGQLQHITQVISAPGLQAISSNTPQHILRCLHDVDLRQGVALPVIRLLCTDALLASEVQASLKT